MGTIVHFSERTSVDLSVVVPCFNEFGGIDELYSRIKSVCESRSGASHEIILVNDGSTDGTYTKIRRLAEVDRNVVGIDLARNYGHQIALTAGLECCRGKRIFILDADLQDPPELLGPMMNKMDEGYDVVYGVREVREGESWFKLSSASIFYSLLGWLSEVHIPANAGDFRLMNRRALDHLIAMPERYRFIRGMVSWIGLRQCAFPYRRLGRFSGETHYPLGKMVAFAIDAMTSFSVAPLRFASHIGIGCGLLGLAMLVYTLGAWIAGQVLPGWTSIASIVLILGSVQLLVLGIFGEYLGRMYMETKRRPLYFINEIASRPLADEAETAPNEITGGPTYG